MKAVALERTLGEAALVTVVLNHTIVWCHDKQVSAPFLCEVLGLSKPEAFGVFLVVELSNGISRDFHEVDGHRPAVLRLPHH